MKCECGYVFDLMADLTDREHPSFGVVADRDWELMLSLETQWQNESDPNRRNELFGRSVELIGSMLECPRCKKLLLVVNGERTNYERVSIR